MTIIFRRKRQIPVREYNNIMNLLRILCSDDYVYLALCDNNIRCQLQLGN